MESLYILIPVSLVFVFVIGWVFWRALEGGQFDDLERPWFYVWNYDDSPRGQKKQKKGSDPID